MFFGKLKTWRKHLFWFVSALILAAAAPVVIDLHIFRVAGDRLHSDLDTVDDYGLDVCGYVADDVPGARGLRVRLREVFARAKAFLDVNILGTEPRFLGKPEIVNFR